MIEIDPSSCRICLEDAAIYPIFENNEEYESIYAKLPMCIREKLADIDGYPRRICLKCKNTSDTICAFINKYEETCKILESKVVKVKLENFDVDDNDDFDDRDSFIFELKLEKPSSPLPSDQIAEKKDPAQLLESLKHLTVKRIKAENELEESAPVQVHENAKKKKGQPKKGTKALSAKSSVKKKNSLENEKQATLKKLKEKVAAAEKNGVSKGASKSQAKTETNIQNEKVVRFVRKATNKEAKQKNVETSFTHVLCDSCGETFTDKHKLGQHIVRIHGEKKFKCTKCPKAYYSNRCLELHLLRHDNIRNKVCDTCNKAFFDNKTLNAHIRVVHKNMKNKKAPRKCRFCDRVFVGARSVIIHERSVHTGERPDVCNVCGGRFYDIVYLREHMRIHTGDTPFKCPVCNKGNTQRSNLKSHIRYNHKISELTPEQLAKIKPSYLKIMKPLGKIKELIQQKEEKMKRMESREKKIFPVKSAVGTPRLCDLCGATFKTADRLSYHRRHTHVERNYKCTKCTQAFLTEHFLTKHIKKMHENVTNVVCDICGKGFFSKTELRSHVITVHLKKKKYKIYKCEFCDKTFKYKKGVIIHERSAHTGERPSTCEVCGSSFLDDVYLAEHMRLHTGEKPYKCPICGSGYAQRGNMKSHMRNHRISDLAPDMLAKIKPSFLKFMRP